MGLRLRVTIVFAILLALVAAVSVLVVGNYTKQQRAQDEIGAIIDPATAIARELNVLQSELGLSLTALTFGKDPSVRSTVAGQLAEREGHVQALTALAAQDRSLQRAVVPVARAINQANSDVIMPILNAVDSNRMKMARATWLSAAARLTNAEIDRSLTVVFDELAQRRESAHQQLAELNRSMGFTLLASVLALLAAWFGVLLVIRNSVLSPVDALRGAMHSATVDRESVITPAGPPDVYALGTDAEAMRRELVSRIDEAEAAREALLQDAPLVAELQTALLPRIPELEWLDLHGTLRAQEGVIAGDWWDVIERPDGSVALVVADVSGHGVSAGAAAVQIRAAVHAALGVGASPNEAIRLAQHALATGEHFATMWIAVIDPRFSSITWANAGHPAPIIVGDDKQIRSCSPTGPLISRLTSDWSDATTSFDAGDVLFAYTDGLFEARDAEGERLNESELGQWIRSEDRPVRVNAPELSARILARARQRAADLDDDVTLVCAVFRPDRGPTPRREPHP